VLKRTTCLYSPATPLPKTLEISSVNININIRDCLANLNQHSIDVVTAGGRLHSAGSNVALSPLTIFQVGFEEIDTFAAAVVAAVSHTLVE